MAKHKRIQLVTSEAQKVKYPGPEMPMLSKIMFQLTSNEEGGKGALLDTNKQMSFCT